MIIFTVIKIRQFWEAYQTSIPNYTKTLENWTCQWIKETYRLQKGKEQSDELWSIKHFWQLLCRPLDCNSTLQMSLRTNRQKKILIIYNWWTLLHNANLVERFCVKGRNHFDALCTQEHLESEGSNTNLYKALCDAHNHVTEICVLKKTMRKRDLWEGIDVVSQR